MSKSNLYDAMVEAGVEIDSHQSDMRVPDTEQTRQICRDLDWMFTPFVDNRTRQQWLDIPFAYSPFWEEK